MILVAIAALWMLDKDFSDIELGIRFLIAIGASLLSGLISYTLFFLDHRDQRK
ncbi:histidine kinase [Cytobacillus gottheilii]|uniref:Histidine kinase n=3 Tax=Bacillaceae TaxID=186817 RepID=A0A7V7RKX2_9BACI|nr:histidine kinase [Bacillus mesophilum]QVY63627.1 histidine kinase [Cytobacillus gottheilii]